MPHQARTERSHVNGEPTTWIQRYCDVIRRFCNGNPPTEMVIGWRNNPDDERLHHWVNANLQPSAAWAQGIEILSTAWVMADAPVEGAGHYIGDFAPGQSPSAPEEG